MNRVHIGALEAKTRLSELLDAVEKGGRFVITRHGLPVAELAPIKKKQTKRVAGFANGLFSNMAEDFNAPLDEFKKCR